MKLLNYVFYRESKEILIQKLNFTSFICLGVLGWFLFSVTHVFKWKM